MPELLTMAFRREDGKRISAESSLIPHRRPNWSMDWTELNWTKDHRSLIWTFKKGWTLIWYQRSCPNTTAYNPTFSYELPTNELVILLWSFCFRYLVSPGWTTRLYYRCSSWPVAWLPLNYVLFVKSRSSFAFDLSSRAQILGPDAPKKPVHGHLHLLRGFLLFMSGILEHCMLGDIVECVRELQARFLDMSASQSSVWWTACRTCLECRGWSLAMSGIS